MSLRQNKRAVDITSPKTIHYGSIKLKLLQWSFSSSSSSRAYKSLKGYFSKNFYASIDLLDFVLDFELSWLGSVHEKSESTIGPSTYPWRRKIKKKIGPKTLNSMKLRFVARTVKLTVRVTKCIMGPSTYPYRRKIKKKIGPETFNSRKLRFLARTVKFNNNRDERKA